MRLLSLFLILAAVSGCVIVDDRGSGHAHKHGRGFCPPGQAKKGHC